MHSLSNPPSPSTTESATNRIDIDTLIAALEAAGWETHEGTFFDMSHVYCYDARRISLYPSHVWISTQPIVGPFGPVNATDPIWHHALDLIRAHTTPARSPDDARPDGAR